MSARSSGFGRFLREIRELIQTGRVSWQMIPHGQRYALFGAIAIMVLSGLANTALPLLSGHLVDRVQSGIEGNEERGAIYESVAVVLASIAGLVLLRELLGVLRRFLVENTCTRIEQHMTVKVVAHLVQVDLSNFTHEKVGTLHGRVFRSVGGFMRLLRLSFLEFFPAVLVGLFAVTAAIIKQPWIGLAMLGVIPTSFGLTVWQVISQKRVRLKLLRVSEEMDGTVVEQLGGLDYIRVANTHAREIDRVAKAAEQKREKEIRHHVAMSFFGAGKAVLEGLFHVGVLALAAYLAITGVISFGDILTFSMLYLSALAPLNEVHRVIDEGHEASLRVLDLRDLLALPMDTSFDAASSHTPPQSPGNSDKLAVRVEGLCVEYRLPNGGHRRALNGVGLDVRVGETVGVAGKSGCGKSTWLKVLMRLLHPADGRVWLNGVPLENVSREMISQLIGYVGQNPFTFSGTIEDNITYGATKWEPGAIERAARMACIHDEIMAMPGGYRAAVSERGSNLSGGQKQRLALARIFLRNPPILILDEATSALDTISERQVQKAIGTASRDRTVIMVAHRLSTFVDADRILVFDDGRIIETGAYAELIEKNGLFAELVRCAEMNAMS
ncbi:ABC transporter ATP-binding protein [Fimbriiglobus ruber]|uniref:Lipid A export ATP-binding/permease protein MsbA n=1 Tax=Fimbriiglobus ruber TaxID=1908690 RepID=A0A225DFU8_9BACT|nr:ABC transporter ATP-binding protein [Fimbriiglobus ruber]OWK40420.1 Lipid A export ATP-binding/permease protein MsbA [Fimbriiglobus ruber]